VGGTLGRRGSHRAKALAVASAGADAPPERCRGWYILDGSGLHCRRTLVYEWRAKPLDALDETRHLEIGLVGRLGQGLDSGKPTIVFTEIA